MEDEEDNHPPRTNGCHWPWNPLLVGSWVLLLFFPVMFGVFTAPFFRSPQTYIWITIYYVVYAAGLVMDGLAMLSNPVDPLSFNKRTPEQMQDEPPEDQNPCYYCKAFVHQSSKHCRTCNKCVVGFDHHCKWLNNCVGDRNYKLFFILVVVSILTMSVQLGVTLFQFIDSFYDSFYAARAMELYSMSLGVWQGITGLIWGLAAVADGLLLHLYGFHLMLAFEDKSTYEFILQQREKRRKRKGVKPDPEKGEEMAPGPAATTSCAANIAAGPSAKSIDTAPSSPVGIGRSNTPVDGGRGVDPSSKVESDVSEPQRYLNSEAYTPYHTPEAIYPEPQTGYVNSTGNNYNNHYSRVPYDPSAAAYGERFPGRQVDVY